MAKMRKDQELALWAYKTANSVEKLEDYENAIQTFAAVLLRSGLEVAVSVLERNLKYSEYVELLRHLAGEPLVPGIPAAARPPAIQAGRSQTAFARGGVQQQRQGEGPRDAGGMASIEAAKEWPASVRRIAEVSTYMLASREIRERVTWLRRACRALNAQRDNSGKGEKDANGTS